MAIVINTHKTIVSLMKKLNSSLYPFLVGLITPILISTIYLFWKVRGEVSDLKFLELTLSALLLLGVLIAYVTYITNRSKGNRMEVSKQIAFFREKVLPPQDDFMSEVKNMGTDFVRVSFFTTDFSSLCKDPEVRIKLVKQRKIAKHKLERGILKEIGALEIRTLNALEEFSIKVLYTKNQNDEALSILHSTFVQTVEMHVAQLFYVRDIEHGRPLFSHTLDLYFLWKTYVSTKTPQFRFQSSESWKYILKETKEVK